MRVKHTYEEARVALNWPKKMIRDLANLKFKMVSSAMIKKNTKVNSVSIAFFYTML